VYRARDSALSEIVALKMLRPGFATDARSLLQFHQEVRLARRVTHRNVARTYDLGEADGHRFLTMELVEGETLAALIDAGPRLPVARTIEIAMSICAGVAAAHDAGVVHRDLKPDNVVIALDGRVVVMDFGIARGVGESQERGGVVLGTPAYMAPEQAQDVPDLDGRADQYALGVMIYEMLTGQVPFPGAALNSLFRRMTEPPPDPRNLRPEIPEALSKLVLRCLARAREDRFLDLHAVSSELRRLPALSGSFPPPTGRKHARGLPTLAIFPLAVIDLPECEHLGWGFADGLIDALSAARASGGARVLRERKLSPEVASMIDVIRTSTATTSRAKTIVSQVQAEARGYCGAGKLCVESVMNAVATGLFDSPWLELCPALECVRTVPEIVEARAIVLGRAQAVLAALRFETRV
jgi:serine/threonine protein kinase